MALVPLNLKIITVGDSKHSDKLGLEVQESEAHAIVPIVAGGAAAAAAAELGISAEVLYLGTAALIAGATGYLVTSDGFQQMGADLKTQWDRLFDGHDVSDMTNDNNYGDGYTDGSLQVGGTPLWDDLSADDKAKFGTPAAYVLGTWDGLEASVGILSETGGNWQPEPSSNGDPLSKLKNAIKIIGVTGGAVAVGEAAEALANTVSGGIKQLLFGTEDEETSLNVAYSASYFVNGARVSFRNDVIASPTGPVHTNDWAGCTQRTNGNLEFCFPTGSEQVTYDLAKYKPTNSIEEIYQKVGSSVSSRIAIVTNGNVSYGSGVTYLRSSWYVLNDETISTEKYWLNPRWIGYNFGDVSYSGGTFSDISNITTEAVEYGQITGTPNDITRNIFNDNDTYIQNVANYQNTAPDGQKYAVRLPGAYGDEAIQPDYSTFVTPLPDGQVTPVPDTKPDDKPITPDPKPDDPTPPDWDFPTALDDAMKNLGEGAFGNLFPFCLVVDIQRLSDKLATSAGYGQTRGGLLMAQGNRAQFTEVVLPLSDFGLPGVEDMTLDCEPVFRLGLMMRSWWTILLMASLIAESVRYFLK